MSLSKTSLFKATYPTSNERHLVAESAHRIAWNPQDFSHLHPPRRGLNLTYWSRCHTRGRSRHSCPHRSMINRVRAHQKVPLQGDVGEHIWQLIDLRQYGHRTRELIAGDNIEGATRVECRFLVGNGVRGQRTRTSRFVGFLNLFGHAHQFGPVQVKRNDGKAMEKHNLHHIMPLSNIDSAANMFQCSFDAILPVGIDDRGAVRRHVDLFERSHWFDPFHGFKSNKHANLCLSERERGEGFSLLTADVEFNDFSFFTLSRSERAQYEETKNKCIGGARLAMVMFSPYGPIVRE